MLNFEVKIDNKVIKFEFGEEKKGVELKAKIIELMELHLDPPHLKVFAAGHYLKDEPALKDQINREKLKLVLAKYEKKDLKTPPPKRLPTQPTPLPNTPNVNQTPPTPPREQAPVINSPPGDDSPSLGSEPELSERLLRLKQIEWESKKSIEKLVEISHRIANRKGDSFDNNTFAVLTDSEGKEFPLSETDRLGLTCGQMLYNFGKKKLFKDKNLEEALRIFEAAEREFLNVSQEVLQMIDNYGLLCLDIAWTYYQMQRLEQLGNAQEKLKIANSFLEKSYGKELERLMKVQGGFAPQKVLFARLHLLQGITRFHKGFFKDAVSYLKQAEDEIRTLRIEPDDPSFVELLNMGFDEVQARNGLRAANRSLSDAIQFLSDEQEKKRDIDKRERERERKRRKEMSYGATANGQRVNLQLLEYYVKELQFEKKYVLEAIKQVNNDPEALSDTLTTPSKLEVIKTTVQLREGERRRKRELKQRREREELIIANCKRMMELGFPEGHSISALQKCEGDLERAVLMLAESDVELPESELSLSQLESSFGNLDTLMGEGAQQGEGEAGTSSTAPTETEEQKREREEKILNEEIEEDLKEAVYQHEHDYLNLTLDDEYHMLVKYKSLLESRNEWY